MGLCARAACHGLRRHSPVSGGTERHDVRAAGTLFPWGGALASAQISFELARRLGRPLAKRFVPERSLQKADQIVLDADWWGLLLPRFIPLIAFTALNWGAGLTAVPRRRFTAIGIFPGALVFTASGVGRPGISVRGVPTLSAQHAEKISACQGRLIHRGGGITAKQGRV